MIIFLSKTNFHFRNLTASKQREAENKRRARLNRTVYAVSGNPPSRHNVGRNLQVAVRPLDITSQVDVARRIGQNQHHERPVKQMITDGMAAPRLGFAEQQWLRSILHWTTNPTVDSGPDSRQFLKSDRPRSLWCSFLAGGTTCNALYSTRWLTS